MSRQYGLRKKLGAKKFDVLMKHSFGNFDKNHDGALNFQEFLRLYTVLMDQYKKLKRDHKQEKASEKRRDQHDNRRDCKQACA